jgi:hypothetical protein
MKCKSIRVRSDLSEDEKRRVVLVTVGNLRQVGCVDEVAWIEMTPAMARAIARDLFEVGFEVEKHNDLHKSEQH